MDSEPPASEDQTIAKRVDDELVRDVDINSNVLFRGDEFVHTLCFTRDVSHLRRLETSARFLIQLDDAVRPLTEAVAITLAAATALGRHLRVNRCAYATVEMDEDTFVLANLAWMARPDGWIYWYNDQWYAYTGTTPEQLEGWRWERVHDPAVLDEVEAVLNSQDDA